MNNKTYHHYINNASYVHVIRSEGTTPRSIVRNGGTLHPNSPKVYNAYVLRLVYP